MSSQPEHVGIIMDGNGRWAKRRGHARTFGHVRGARVAKKIITACSRRKIKYVTLYAFSTENWYRPGDEVLFLMQLLRRYLRREVENLMKENIRFQVIGETERLPNDLQKAIADAAAKTAGNTGLTLIFAMSYGSRREIADAAKRVANKVLDGTLKLSEINEETFSQHLQTYPAPDPDLIIRTSGESRLSNFLMWQAAYAELYFSPTLWPDFTEAELDAALASFGSRTRRFGALTADHEQPRT